MRFQVISRTDAYWQNIFHCAHVKTVFWNRFVSSIWIQKSLRQVRPQAISIVFYLDVGYDRRPEFLSTAVIRTAPHAANVLWAQVLSKDCSRPPSARLLDQITTRDLPLTQTILSIVRDVPNDNLEPRNALSTCNSRCLLPTILSLETSLVRATQATLRSNGSLRYLAWSRGLFSDQPADCSIYISLDHRPLRRQNTSYITSYVTSIHNTPHLLISNNRSRIFTTLYCMSIRPCDSKHFSLMRGMCQWRDPSTHNLRG
jgi:hypothetical protein